MTPAEKRLTEALAVLEALRPFQDTGWERETLSKAWDKARAAVTVAVNAYLTESHP